MAVTKRAGTTSGGRWVRPTEKKPGADLARSDSTTYTSDAFPIEDALEIDVELKITALGSGATATLKLQCSTDGTVFYDAPGGALPAQSATGSVEQSVVCPGIFGRWVLTIAQGATPVAVAYTVDTQARVV